MAGQGLRIPHIHHSLEQSKSVKALRAGLEASLHPDCQQRAAPISQILLRHWIERAIWKSGIIDPFDCAMCAQELSHSARVLYVALHSERQCLDTLQEQKTIEGR